MYRGAGVSEDAFRFSEIGPCVGVFGVFLYEIFQNNGRFARLVLLHVEAPAQTQFVLELLFALYQRDRELPALYLISPFKAIKAGITKGILDLDWAKGAQRIEPPKKQELKKWCRERVGTVHTFQGKEEDSVLMVLGADWRHAGSADWACAKPNILNVALTRARRRFYLVGDRELWGTRGPFAGSVDRLSTMTAHQFLTIARNGFSLGKSTGP